MSVIANNGADGTDGEFQSANGAPPPKYLSAKAAMFAPHPALLNAFADEVVGKFYWIVASFIKTIAKNYST